MYKLIVEVVYLYMGGKIMVILEANKIRKIYGKDKNTKGTLVLDGIDMKVQKGEFVGIMGPSGSGKTTLLNILSSLSKATSGDIEIAGKNLNSLDSHKLSKFRRKTIGFVFQDFNLLDSLTLKENILLPMVLEKESLEYMEETCNNLIKVLDLQKVISKYPYEVSGGEQQRTAIARALVNNPEILFADEPTGNLDSKASNSIMNYFEYINERRKDTILMVTHDVFAASFCKRVIFIKDGKLHLEIARKGSKKDFFNEILNCTALLGGGSSEF